MFLEVFVFLRKQKKKTILTFNRLAYRLINNKVHFYNEKPHIPVRPPTSNLKATGNHISKCYIFTEILPLKGTFPQIPVDYTLVNSRRFPAIDSGNCFSLYKIGQSVNLDVIINKEL